MSLRHPYFENLCLLKYCDGVTALRILFLPFVYNSTSLHEMLRLRLNEQPFSCRILRALPPSLTMMYIRGRLAGDCESDGCDSRDYSDALLWACQSGALDEFQYLLSLTEKNARSNPWLLIAAAEEGQLHVVNYLIASEGLQHRSSYFIEIAIDGACVNGHLDVVKTFISRGVIPDSFFLANACLNEHLEIAKYLVSYGTDARELSDDVISFLCRRGSWGMMEYLVSQGRPSLACWNALRLGRKSGWARSVLLFATQQNCRLLSAFAQGVAIGIASFSISYAFSRIIMQKLRII